MNKKLASELVNENEATSLSISGLKSVTSEYNTNTHTHTMCSNTGHFFADARTERLLNKKAQTYPTLSVVSCVWEHEPCVCRCLAFIQLQPCGYRSFITKLQRQGGVTPHGLTYRSVVSGVGLTAFSYTLYNCVWIPLCLIKQ